MLEIRPVTIARFALTSMASLCFAACASDGRAILETRMAIVQEASTKPPHVVLIVADDLGYADLGFTGVEDIATPHLDRLAEEGVVCTDAHVTAAVCAPSRAGILSGGPGLRFGFECNLAGEGGLPEEDVLLVDDLQDAGYRTALIGKWHQGDRPHQHPNAVGFDEFFGLIGGSRGYWPMTNDGNAKGGNAKGGNPNRRLQRNGRTVDESEHGYLTDVFADRAVQTVLEHDGDEALFLMLSFTAPHTPMEAPEEELAALTSIKNQKRRTYAAMVQRMDAGVGRVLEALEARAWERDTLVVFLSDNGGATNNASDNGEWRGMKGSKWEGGQRVPFVMRWPARWEPGEYDGLVSAMDLLPTVLAAAGVDPPAGDATLCGVDLNRYLGGSRSQSPREQLFWRRSVAAAARVGDWKLIRVQEADGSWRAPLLFDLERDPGELEDRSSAEPARVQRMLAALADWESHVQPRLWGEGERWENNQRAKHELERVGRDAERRVP